MTDDKTVIATVLSGNTDAYSLLVEKYQIPLYRIALSILHHPHDAEDLLQEAFVQGYLRLSSLRSPERYYPWMVQILKKRCFNALRRTRQTESDEIHAEYIASLPDDSPTPEELLLTEENENRVLNAVNALPHHLRETARLFFLHGIKQKNIASHLGIPEGTVKRRIHDAKIRLRKELDTMTNTNMQMPADNFAARVAEKIAELENYNKIHGSSDGFEAAYRDTIALIGEMSDKEEANTMAAKATKIAYIADHEKYMDEAIESAVKSRDPLLLFDAFMTKRYTIDNLEERLAYTENTVIPTLDALSTNSDTAAEAYAAKGRILFWAYYDAMTNNSPDRGKAYLTEAKALLAEYAPRIKNPSWIPKNTTYCINSRALYISMIACAEAGEIDFAKRENNSRFRPDSYSTSVTAQGWRKEGGNLFLEFQPGFSLNKGDMFRYTAEVLYYAACESDGWFFPHTNKVGETEVVRSKWNQWDAVQSIISDDETVLTPTGVYENCRHIRKTTNRSIYDIWYADGVGLVRFDNRGLQGASAETYLLSECEIRGGEGYLPVEVGNHWKYTNTTAPEGIEGTVEYTIVRNDEDYVYVTGNEEAGILLDAPADAPDIMLMDAKKYVEDRNCDKNDYDSYRAVMEQIIMGNKTRESVEIALNAVDYLKERKIYSDGNYRFLPSSCCMSTITKANGKILYNGAAVHVFSTGRWGTRGDAENRIFGAKPFRYPNWIAGAVWNDAWEIGYTKRGKMELQDEEYTLTVTDGGTVTTKAGTFENCRKVTITCEAKNKEGHYYFYSYTDCGVKEYWYAPGVGLVFHRCQWGPCESECELVSYHTVSAPNDHFPIHIGNRWSYEEKNLTREGYVARHDYAIVSGMNNTYLMRDNQMFVYLGTEAEYESWKDSGCPVKE